MWTRTFNNSVGVSGRRLAGKKSGGLIGNKLVSMLRGKFKRSHASTTSTPETITTLIEILFVPLRVDISSAVERKTRFIHPVFIFSSMT